MDNIDKMAFQWLRLYHGDPWLYENQKTFATACREITKFLKRADTATEDAYYSRIYELRQKPITLDRRKAGGTYPFDGPQDLSLTPPE